MIKSTIKVNRSLCNSSSIFNKNIIPEQFTVNAHPEEGAKNEVLLFQSTVDIHFQNAHKTQKLRRLALCAFIFVSLNNPNLKIKL